MQVLAMAKVLARAQAQVLVVANFQVNQALREFSARFPHLQDLAQLSLGRPKSLLK